MSASARRLLRESGRPVAFSTLLLAGHQVAEALVPVVIGRIVDRSITTGDAAALGRWLGVLVVLFLLLSFAWRFGDRLAMHAIVDGDHRVRLDLVRVVLHPRRAAGDRSSGELLSVATSDSERLAYGAAAIGVLGGAVAAIVVAAVFLLQISVPLGLLVLLGLPVALVALERLARPLERRSEVEQEAAAEASSVAADILRGLRVVKGIGAEAPAADRYRRASRASLDATVRAAAFAGGHQGATSALTGLFLALVALVAGRLGVDGEISVGDAIAAIGLTQFLIGPVGRLSWSFGAARRSAASARRVDDVLESPVALQGSDHPGDAMPAVALRNVTSPGLDRVSFTCNEGEVLGVAADAATSRAIVELLALEAVAQSGSIEVGGSDVLGLDPEPTRALLLVSPHDADLFEGSLGDNIEARAGGEDAVKRAISAAAVDDVAAVLPGGLDGHVLARGASLSGGQRQRVALARALAADPPVLVLHDPTTAVDAVTEQSIAAGIRELRAGRSTVVVSTSSALLAITDRVVLVVDGAVVAASTHDELLTDARYRDLVLA
jgi:putative ABC transport system ATP-binding protein